MPVYQDSCEVVVVSPRVKLLVGEPVDVELAIVDKSSAAEVSEAADSLKESVPVVPGEVPVEVPVEVSFVMLVEFATVTNYC